MKIINSRTFIDDTETMYNIPFEHDEYDLLNGVIELKNKFIFNFTTPENEMKKTNIVCINKQTKEIEWIVEPCFEWEIKQIHQYMNTRATNYAMIEGLVRCEDGNPWQIEVMHSSNPDLEKLDDEKLYQLREEYTNYENYCLKDEILYIRKVDGKLISEKFMEEKYTRNELNGLIGYSDLSNYSEEECLVVATAGAYWYEIDHTNGKVIPAFVDKRMYK